MPSPGRRFAIDLLGRLWKFFVIFGAVYVGAAVAFFELEQPHVSLFNSFYWSIVTLGTVGYGDIVPTTEYAKILTTIVIATQIFLLGYLISVIAGTVNEQAEHRALGTYGTSMKGHIVVLGYSGVGRAAVRELLVQDQKVAVVTDQPDEVPNVRSLAPEDRLFVTYGSPSEREILERVNLKDAHSVIACTADDATNMISALNVRALDPTIRVVVAVSRVELRDTLRAAGVTYVASPSDMGGRLCAAAAFEPEVAHAIEDMTAADIRSDIQEYVLAPSSPLVGMTFAEADAIVRRATGCLLIGYAHPDATGEYQTFVNPPFETRLGASDAVILVATLVNAKRFRQWFGADQGR